jgi:hypothetical protein
MENTCFICGIDRFTLDMKGGGFERHVAHDHNMWAYLYLLCHLWDKEPTSYNGWEQHVASLVAEGDVSSHGREPSHLFGEPVTVSMMRVCACAAEDGRPRGCRATMRSCCVS